MAQTKEEYLALLQRAYRQIELAQSSVGIHTPTALQGRPEVAAAHAKIDEAKASLFTLAQVAEARLDANADLAPFIRVDTALLPRLESAIAAAISWLYQAQAPNAGIRHGIACLSNFGRLGITLVPRGNVADTNGRPVLTIQLNINAEKDAPLPEEMTFTFDEAETLRAIVFRQAPVLREWGGADTARLGFVLDIQPHPSIIDALTYVDNANAAPAYVPPGWYAE